MVVDGGVRTATSTTRNQSVDHNTTMGEASTDSPNSSWKWTLTTYPRSTSDTITMSASPDRDLPDDQVQIENEDEYEKSELQTMERAMNLSKQFEEVKRRTVEDGMVLGKLVDIQTSANNDRISVEIDLPAEGDTKQKRFRKPKQWSNKYDFVRWIKHYGYTADSFPNMIKDDCKVKVKQPSESGDYELFIPEQRKSWWDKISDVSIPPAYRIYKKSGVPIFQTIAAIAYVVISGLTAIGSIHLMPSPQGELVVVGGLSFVLMLIVVIENNYIENIDN